MALSAQGRMNRIRAKAGGRGISVIRGEERIYIHHEVAIMSFTV